MAKSMWCCTFVTLLVSLAAAPIRVSAQAVVPATGTQARAEGGAILSRGNSDNESFNAKFNVEREWRRWKQAFGTSGVYAADSGGATGQRWDVRGQTDYKFLSHGFSFSRVVTRTIDFRGLNTRRLSVSALAGGSSITKPPR